MKKRLLLLLFLALSGAAFSQNSSFTLTGGWAVALPNNSDVAANGFKISGHWDKAIMREWGFGVDASYVNFKQTGSKTSANSINKYHSYPVTIHGKYLFGNDKFQAFAKVGAGLQLSTISAETSNIYVSDHSFGLAFTAGAGAFYVLTEYLSLTLDYELLYLSNADYNSGMINSVSLGVRFMMH